MILAGMKIEELESLMAEMNATKFRAKQIHNWIYSKSVSSIDEMTNLSKDFREELKKQGLGDYVRENYKSRISRLEQIQAQIYAKAKERYSFL